MDHIDISADKKNNILICILKGYMQSIEMQICLEKIKNESQLLDDGFIFVNDLHSISSKEDKYKEEFIDALLNYIYPKVSKVITISRDLNFWKVLKQDTINLFGLKPEYKSVRSISEANDYLSKQ